MRLRPFGLQRFFARHEFRVQHLLCASDCETLSLGEVLAMEPGAAEAFGRLDLGYTESAGGPALRAGDHLIVHTPAYSSLHEVARGLGCEVTEWVAREADGWSLDVDEAARSIRPATRAIVVNCWRRWPGSRTT